MGFEWEWLSRSRNKNDLRADQVRPSVAEYQRLSCLSDFHEIRYRSYLQNVIEHLEFRENRLADIYTSGGE
jgi:hypothetical protein